MNKRIGQKFNFIQNEMGRNIELAFTKTKLIFKHRMVFFIQFGTGSNILVFNYFKSIELCEESRF